MPCILSCALLPWHTVAFPGAFFKKINTEIPSLLLLGIADFLWPGETEMSRGKIELMAPSKQTQFFSSPSPDSSFKCDF